MKLIREVHFFVLVGLAATFCHASVALAAHHFLPIGPLTAGSIGYLVAVSISYLGNSLLTFRRPVMHGPQFARFATISLAGFGINQSIVYVTTHLMGWQFKFAMIPVVIVVPASTFLMSKFWAFRHHAPAPPIEAAEAVAD